ncbi:MAG: hypothetical protein SLAVMIC_00990 [uncultured marine phage]|uniref:Uncharacterized protein n=1 Tax=uncultured marine phage TaxID=707152 RepID=A0A8D9CD17_9VIRU|nr:MAG: hypothetical protein SLAVMIC_00990 [uncultured marine phage]
MKVEDKFKPGDIVVHRHSINNWKPIRYIIVRKEYTTDKQGVYICKTETGNPIRFNEIFIELDIQYYREERLKKLLDNDR